MRRIATIWLLMAVFPGCMSKSDPTPSRSAEQANNSSDDEAEAPVCLPGHSTQGESITDPDLPETVRTVTPAEFRRLRVEWGKPSLKDDDRGVYLEMPGRLLIVGEDGQARPVDWIQPVDVLLAIKPDSRPDWSTRHDEDDTANAIAVVGFELDRQRRIAIAGEDAKNPITKPKPGEFIARFSPAQIRRPIGAKAKFQIGLCLGGKMEQRLSWTNVTPVVAQSVAMVEIAGPAKLSDTARLINACPSINGWDFDPAALVRASNHLRSLGKKDAVAGLREFFLLSENTWHSHFGPKDPTNIDDADPECLLFLMPLVFERPDPQAQVRFKHFEELIIVSEGIPFHVVKIDGGSGGRPFLQPHIEWAEKQGRVIEKPMRPTDRPLDAADALFDRIAKPEQRNTDPRFPGLREHLRCQAWRMIAHLVEPERKALPTIRDKVLKNEKRWAELKAKVAQLNIRWDEKRQEYVSAK